MIFRYRVVAWIILVSVFAWTGQAWAGWVIEQVVKGGPAGGRQQANRMKTLMLSPQCPALQGHEEFIMLYNQGVPASRAASKLPPSCSIKLNVTWKADTRGYGGYSKIELRGEYEVEQFEPVVMLDGSRRPLHKLKYLRGGLVQASGAFGDDPAVYGDPGFPVLPGSLNQSTKSIPPDGYIRRSKAGSHEINFLRGPGLKALNAAAEEAAGCWGEWPTIEISPSMLRDLHELRITRKKPVNMPEAPECQGEMTVEITGIPLVREGTLPDPDDPTVSAFDCNKHGGSVSLDGIWCLGGDYSCYRITGK